jgi:hypothetical protein
MCGRKKVRAGLRIRKRATCRESDSSFCNRRPRGGECLSRTIGAKSRRAGKRLIAGEVSSAEKTSISPRRSTVYSDLTTCIGMTQPTPP